MAKLSWSLLCCIALWHCRSSCAAPGDKPELPTLKRQRQRLGSTSAVSKTGSASEGPRSLKRKVAETFLSNKLSAKDIFELSDAANAEACSQGASSSARDLAQAGARGAHPQNFARDILARLVRGTAHQLFWHPIPFYDPKAKEDIVLSHPFLLPHEMILGLVHAHGLENFSDRLWRSHICYIGPAVPAMVARSVRGGANWAARRRRAVHQERKSGSGVLTFFRLQQETASHSQRYRKNFALQQPGLPCLRCWFGLCECCLQGALANICQEDLNGRPGPKER